MGTALTTSVVRKKALAGNFRLASVYAAILCLFPIVYTEYSNAETYSYPTAATYIICKLIVWFIVPTVFFYFSFRCTKTTAIFRHLCILWPLIGISYYFSQSLWHALLVSLALHISWKYSESLFVKYMPGIVLGVFGFFFYFAVRQFDVVPIISKQFTPVLSESTEALRLHFPWSLYLILFDELSKSELYHQGIVKPSLPNFSSLASEATSPDYSFTNYDLTQYAIATMFSGKLPSNSMNVLKLFQSPNLFDFTKDKQSVVVGTALPYCQILREKKVPAICFDRQTTSVERNSFEILNLKEHLRIDLVRLGHIYLSDAPAMLLLKALSLFTRPESAPALQKTLFAHTKRIFSIFWDLEHSRELKRLAEFEKTIGTTPRSLYYYHSVFPHFPYNANQDLSQENRYPHDSFYHATSTQDIEQTNTNYWKNVTAADTVLGRLIQRIKEQDPHSVIIVTGDHGVARDFSLPLMRSTGHFIPDVVEIPLFIWLPEDHPLKQQPVHRYQHLDFLPTIFDIMGQAPPPDLEGKSIYSEEKSKLVFITGAQTLNIFHEDSPLWDLVMPPPPNNQDGQKLQKPTREPKASYP